jgi:hypothetical protein
MVVALVHYGMPTLPRATQCNVALAEAGVATNRASVRRHVTLSARREAEAGVATTSS